MPPKTTAELEATAKKLTNPGAGKFGLAYAYSDFYYHAALMNGFGGGVFGPNRKPTLNSPQNVASLDYLMKWFGMGFLPAEPSTALITSLFNDGKAAMVFSGPWFLGEIAKGVDYGLAPLPTISEAGNKPIRPWITVEGVYVAAPSKAKDAAFAFAKYLTDVPAGKVMALQGRQTPANKAVYADAAVSSDPILKAFRQQVDVAVPMPNLPEMSMVWSPRDDGDERHRQEGGDAQGGPGSGAEGSDRPHRHAAQEVEPWTATPPRPVSYRRLFLAGLALAALLGAGGGALLLRGARKAESRGRAERQAVITLSALVDLVDRAGGVAAAALETTPAPAAPADAGGMGARCRDRRRRAAGAGEAGGRPGGGRAPRRGPLRGRPSGDQGDSRRRLRGHPAHRLHLARGHGRPGRSPPPGPRGKGSL